MLSIGGRRVKEVVEQTSLFEVKVKLSEQDAALVVSKEPSAISVIVAYVDERLKGNVSMRDPGVCSKTEKRIYVPGDAMLSRVLKKMRIL